MTIAAGFICTDGLVVCADGEQTDQTTKYHRSKVFTFGDSLIVTGAGASAHIKMTFDKLCDEYRTAQPVNVSDARDVAEIGRAHV